MQRRDALVVGVGGIVLARLEQLLHAGDVAYPGHLHDVVLRRVAGQVAELDLVVQLGRGRVRLGRRLRRRAVCGRRRPGRVVRLRHGRDRRERADGGKAARQSRTGQAGRDEDGLSVSSSERTRGGGDRAEPVFAWPAR